MEAHLLLIVYTDVQIDRFAVAKYTEDDNNDHCDDHSDTEDDEMNK